MNLIFKIFVPVLLLITATLKLIKFMDSPYDGFLGSPILEISSIFLEYLLATLILSSYKENIALLLSKVMFFSYAIVGIANIYGGQSTCGCLGLIDVSVKYMLALNTFIFCSLCFCHTKKTVDKLSDTYKVIAISLFMIYGSAVVFFAAAENPNRQLKIIRGHNILLSSDVIYPINNEPLYIEIENISNNKVNIIGFNSNKKVNLGTKLPLSIEKNTKLKIPVGFMTDDLQNFNADIKLLTDSYPRIIKLKLIGIKK